MDNYLQKTFFTNFNNDSMILIFNNFKTLFYGFLIYFYIFDIIW